jgi:hypothetical protein
VKNNDKGIPALMSKRQGKSTSGERPKMVEPVLNVKPQRKPRRRSWEKKTTHEQKY